MSDNSARKAGALSASPATAKRGRALVVWAVLYVVLMAAIAASMTYLRQRVLAGQGAAGSNAAWQEWVREAQRQSTGTGPVQRQPPTSPNPPAQVLLHDYFGVCLAALLILSSALYLTLVFLVQGVLQKPTRRWADRTRDDVSP